VWVVWVYLISAYVSVVPIDARRDKRLQFTLYLGSDGDTGSKGPFIARFMKGTEEKCRRLLDISKGFPFNHLIHYTQVNTNNVDVTSVELHNLSGDALYVDYATLIEYEDVFSGSNGNPEKAIKTSLFGRDGGSGYCLSKDASDYKYFPVTQCYPGLQFLWGDQVRTTVPNYTGGDNTYCEPDEKPEPEGSCMSGNTGLMKVEKDDHNLINEKQERIQKKKNTDLKVGDKVECDDKIMELSTCSREAIGEFGFGPPYDNYTNIHSILNPSSSIEMEETIEVTRLTDLKVGDKIHGYDETMQLSTCSVEAIGEFGFGPLYGNYTDDHFILNSSTGMIEEHGSLPSDICTKGKKYQILTDCPLGVDESGIKFTPIDSDFCGKRMKEMSWKDYVLLHKGILRIVRATGGFWFSISSYTDMEAVERHAPPVCASMLKCMKDSKDCKHFEKNSIVFIDNTLSEFSKAIVKDVFPNIGSHNKLGSVAATLSAGKSIISKTIAEGLLPNIEKDNKLGSIAATLSA